MTRLLFFVPDNNQPSGGVNVIFDLVKTLSTNEIDACVMSSNPTFRYDYPSRDPQIYFAPQIREKRDVRDHVKVLSGRLSRKHNPQVVASRDDIVVMSRGQVAQSLREARIFPSFSELEGVGLPPAEAMLERCRNGDPQIEAMRGKASEPIAQDYGLERHEAAVLKVFGEWTAPAGAGQA